MGPGALSAQAGKPQGWRRVKAGYSREARITEGLRDLAGDFNLKDTDSLGGKGWKWEVL